METKISTAEQVSQLKIGAIIKRFPSSGESVDVFDDKQIKHIDTFVIRSIHPENKMIGLVATGPSLPIFAPPGEIGRLFIHADQVVGQKIWWQ